MRCSASAGVLCLILGTCPASPAAQTLADTRDARVENGDVADSREVLSRRVAPSVVQIRVDGYSPIEDGSHPGPGLVVGLQERTGSGTIIDVDGYIVTTASLVAAAQNVRVVVHRSPADAKDASLDAAGNTVDARIVGLAPELDLALLKISAAERLRSLPIARSGKIRRGLRVFAFGRGDDFRPSFTMGNIGTVALQLSADAPAVYLQTDTPMGPGSGGGPLVTGDGELVGVNAFSIAASSGKPGLTFAIPGAVLAAAYPRLRDNGRLRMGVPGMQVQGITPILMAGLGLPTMAGVVVSDVAPDAVADRAGVHVEDVIETINGQRIDSVPKFALTVSLLGPADALTLGVLRGTGRLSIEVPGALKNPAHAGEPMGPDTTLIAQLGIVAADVARTQVATAPLRIPSGVLVAARDQRSLGRNVPLMTGDVIHAIDGAAVSGVNTLQRLLKGVVAGSPVVLQVERAGRLRFIAVEIFEGAQTMR